jgi:hypothetical protein
MAARKFFTGLLTVIIFCFGCSEKPKPLTDQEVNEFGKNLEASVNKRQAEFFDNAIDRKTLIKKANIPPGSHSEPFKRGLNKGMDVGTSLKQALSANATYTMIKHYTKDDVHHLLFRLYDDGRLNYHDMELTRAKGEPRIADMFIYTAGENLSETLHKIYLQFAPMMKDKSFVNQNDTWLTKMPEIRQLMAQDKYREALEIYNRIPDSIQKGRAFQILHVQVSSGLSSEEYNAAIEEYKRLYPNEPNMHLLLLDGYIINKEYEKALNAINELDRQINKDPLLDYYRFLCYKLMNDAGNAKSSLLRLTQNMPDFADGQIELIAMNLDENNQEEARKIITSYRNKKSFDQELLTTLLNQYPGFTE